MAPHNKHLYRHYIHTLRPRPLNFKLQLQEYANAVINPPPMPPGQLRCLRVRCAWMLAVATITRRRVPANFDRMAIAQVMFDMTGAAPIETPFAFSLLDAERTVIDALHFLASKRVDR